MGKKFAQRDCLGRPLKVGDVVRVVGLQDLSDMDRESRAESEPVFRHIIGTYKKIADFDELGHAELQFKIRKGRPHAGYHFVWVEPRHLRLRVPRTA